ncbi:MAG: hypothetical protein ABSA76_01340 [Bacteroidales bacterium]
MSTRANVILKDESSKLIFYKHSDGYPEGVLPVLNKFMDWLNAGKIRNNVSQSAGWLIILGAMEYNTIPKFKAEKPEGVYPGSTLTFGNLDTFEDPKDWKVGAYEPTTCIHGDIEFLYTIDLKKAEISVQEVRYNYETDKTYFKDLSPEEIEDLCPKH